MTVITERRIRRYVALETFQPSTNPFVLGAGRLGASKLAPAGSAIVWSEWTDSVVNIDATRGGKVSDLAHRNEVGTLSVTLRGVNLDTDNPEFVAGQSIRLVHVNGTKRHTIFTGSIREIDVHKVRYASQGMVSLLQLVAVDAVREHNEITRYGVFPDTGTETLAARLDRLSRSATTPIAQPTEAIPGMLGRTVYESSLSNHLDLACNTVGAFWYVDGDGVTRVRHRHLAPTWAEQRRNLATNPVPTTVTGWLPAPGAVTSNGYTYTVLGTAATPYIFSTPSTVGAVAGHVYAFRAKVKAKPAPGSAFATFSIRPHKNTGNVYYVPEGGIVVHPADNVEREVAFYFKAPVNMTAGEGFNLSAVGGGTGTAGSTMSMRDVLIEDVGTVVPSTPPGKYFAGSTDMGSYVERTRWVGVANASASVLEVPSNVAMITDRREEYPGYPFPENALHLVNYTGARGSRVTYTGLDYDNHGAQLDPENPGSWIADDQIFEGMRLPAVARYGLRVGTLPANHPYNPGVSIGGEILLPYSGDFILAETLLWNAQEDITRVPDLDVGSYIDLPLLGDTSAAVWRTYIVGGVRHVITPTRWLIELSLIGVPRAL